MSGPATLAVSLVAWTCGAGCGLLLARRLYTRPRGCPRSADPNPPAPDPGRTPPPTPTRTMWD